MVHAADDILKFKYIVKNTALEWGKVATFMPKPLFGDNGSGMHTHQSLWNGSEPLFYDEKGYGGLGDIAPWDIRRPPTHPSPAGTSAACSSTLPLCSRSPTPRSTPTVVWFPASRLPSTWSTRPATAPP